MGDPEGANDVEVCAEPVSTPWDVDQNLPRFSLGQLLEAGQGDARRAGARSRRFAFGTVIGSSLLLVLAVACQAPPWAYAAIVANEVFAFAVLSRSD